MADSAAPALACTLNEKDLFIKAVHKEKSASRTRVFMDDLPSSWPRFVFSLASIVLVCSDIPRSGLGYKHLPAFYLPIEPDSYNYVGKPWDYTVFEIAKLDAASESAPVWSYKFDTTSYVWRAFARFFKLDAFPSCVMYKSDCLESTLPGETVFNMIDAVASSTANLSTGENSLEPTVATVRSDGIFRDRFHNFLLPELFLSHNWRTNQATHYSNESLARIIDRPHLICFSRGARPSLCADQWLNFCHSCPDDDKKCKEVGLMYIHMINRVRESQRRFPNLTIDFTMLESNEDMQSVRGGLSTLAFRRSDVSTIIRARDCSQFSGMCETVWVSDYRYESCILVTDARQWYIATLLLRVVGQSYFYLRVFGLALSCFFVQTPDSSVVQYFPLKTRLRQTLRLLPKVPSQCIVYGSPFPIFCYAFAHLIDAPISSSILEHRFVTQNGALDFSLEQFFSLAVIQMRNVWLYALLLHIAVLTGISYRWIGWYRVRGVFGVHEFLLNVLSSITISAQFRSTEFRSAKILNVYEVATSQRHSLPNIKYFEGITHRGHGNTFMGGITIDFKYLICEVGLLLGAIVVIYSMLTAIRISGIWQKAPLPSELVQTHTPVPYSTGILWPSISLCVHWPYNYFSVRTESMNRSRTSSCFAMVAPQRRRRQYYADAKEIKKVQVKMKSFVELTLFPSNRPSNMAFEYIQFHMDVLHDRRSDVEGNIAFMNLVLMSDPIVFFYLRVGRGRMRQLAYYQSMFFPTQVVLLPRRVVVEDNEHSVGLCLLRPVAVCDLSWSELVQCG